MPQSYKQRAAAKYFKALREELARGKYGSDILQEGETLYFAIYKAETITALKKRVISERIEITQHFKSLRTFQQKQILIDAIQRHSSKREEDREATKRKR